MAIASIEEDRSAFQDARQNLRAVLIRLTASLQMNEAKPGCVASQPCWPLSELSLARFMTRDVTFALLRIATITLTLVTSLRTAQASVFYNTKVVASTNQPGPISGATFAEFDKSPSVNNLGEVAFVGRTRRASDPLLWENLFISDPTGDSTSALMPSIWEAPNSGSPRQVFGVPQINDASHVLAIRRLDPILIFTFLVQGLPSAFSVEPPLTYLERWERGSSQLVLLAGGDPELGELLEAPDQYVPPIPNPPNALLRLSMRVGGQLVGTSTDPTGHPDLVYFGVPGTLESTLAQADLGAIEVVNLVSPRSTLLGS